MQATCNIKKFWQPVLYDIMDILGSLINFISNHKWEQFIIDIHESLFEPRDLKKQRSYCLLMILEFVTIWIREVSESGGPL